MAIFTKTDILIPKKGTDNAAWSVAACDQYTSEPEYWARTEKACEGKPSAYHLILPEAYLGTDKARSTDEINADMRRYLDAGVFEELTNTMIYVKRTQRDGRVRAGIVGAVDLEAYDFSKGSESLIRATEGTVLERIPPRVKIRENAPIELTHIIMLIDDDAKSVIEPLENEIDGMDELYDFELRESSGHLQGFKLTAEQCESVSRAVDALCSQEHFSHKYATDKLPLAIAVGDGNHSLASAKTHWENVKRGLTEECKNHPARFALVELENVHSPALDFEPIHRVVSGVEPEKMMRAFSEFYNLSETEVEGAQKVEYLYGDVRGTVWITDPKSTLAVGSLQIFIDDYIAKNGGACDYIHGAEVVKRLSAAENNIGFLVPKMQKSELFKTVINDGALPRKTFSMGEAHDKRFYYEAKKIR